MTTITNASITKVATTILDDVEIQQIEDQEETQTWWFSGNLKQNLSQLVKGELVFLEADMQNGKFVIHNKENTVQIQATMDITMNWL